MHERFIGIKAVGFDLDNTLYNETPEMKDVAIRKVAEKILEIMPQLETIENAKQTYWEKYKALGSWSKLFREEFGIVNPAPILLDCFEKAGTFNLIKKDDSLVASINLLAEKYFLFLITGSSKQLAYLKLGKIGIDPAVFKFSFFADDPFFKSKLMPDNYQYFLSRSRYQPHEHVYVGDTFDSDIFVPKSLGMKTIFVGESPVAEADYSISDIHAIRDLLL